MPELPSPGLIRFLEYASASGSYEWAVPPPLYGEGILTEKESFTKAKKPLSKWAILFEAEMKALSDKGA